MNARRRVARGPGHPPADGNLQSSTDDAVGVGAWTTAYAHDKADRLTGETRTGGPSGNYAATYAYDANGNRTSVTRGGTAYPYGACGNNDQFTSGEGFAFSNYDADGNPQTVALPGGTMALAYDEVGRVTSIAGYGASAFRYDGDGRRVERTVSGGLPYRFVYDGDQVVSEVDGTANGTFLYRVPGVGTVRLGVPRYDQSSMLGSLLTSRDASGAATERAEYDAYGREVYATGTRTRDFRFAAGKGYVSDDATGMQLLGARYYLPALGRFLTPDPIGHEGGLNLYAYCENSPLLSVDPDGLEPQKGAGWGNAIHAGLGFVFGVGPDRNVYTEQDGQGRDMRDSMMGRMINLSVWASYVNGHGLKPSEALKAQGSDFGFKFWKAGHMVPFAATVAQLDNATQAQVGGFVWDARRSGNRILIHVHNEMTPQSLLYQIPMPKFNRFGSGFGPMGTVHQDFYWWMDVPKGYRSSVRKR